MPKLECRSQRRALWVGKAAGCEQNEAVKLRAFFLGFVAIRKGAMRRGITPFGVKVELAAQTQGLDRLLVAIIGRQLEVIEQLASAGDHAKEATAGAVILDVGGQMGREMIDALRQNRDLDIGASGVFVVDFEVGGGSGDFAHGVFIGGVPDNLSGVLFSIGY